MGRPRSELSAILKAIPGVQRVYFQRPSMERLLYPCIIYELDAKVTQHADNRPYTIGTRYMVSVLDPDPESKIATKVEELPSSSFNRFYAEHDLYHYVYTLYF